MKDRQKIPKIQYYSSLTDDDFAKNKIKTETVDKSFLFIRSSALWRALSWLVYYIVAIPVLLLISKTYLGLKIENRGEIKKLKKTGFFLYGNHTRDLDAFLGPLVSRPKKAYIIANADAVSIKGIKHLVQLLGCLPIPTGASGMVEFMRAVEQRAKQGSCVTIFPEAHIWPFYTGIRPFSAVSFCYPAKLKLPVVAMCTTYRKRKGLFFFAKKPAMTLHISPPIYPKSELSERQNKEFLRDEVYAFMEKEAAKPENIAYIEYKKRAD